jgi:hypothetical protein
MMGEEITNFEQKNGLIRRAKLEPMNQKEKLETWE